MFCGRTGGYAARMNGIQAALRRIQRDYAGDAERPLAGYAAALVTYGVTLTGMVLTGRLAGARMPIRWTAGDVAMLSAATFMGSRLISKDAVTSPLRAPFARYQEPAGEAELNESVRGNGVRHAVGEMVTCPFCLAVWLATALGVGLVVAPRTTRTVNAVLTAVAASDALQLCYDGAKRLAQD